MKGFVASWFFPPVTSAEGLVTFKLLKASAYNYDVCSSLSNQWSYKQTKKLESTNINTIAIQTDDLNNWVDKAVEAYENKSQEYNFIMTRSMPPESHKVGLSIKQKHPEAYWIASFGDPIAYNPYELLVYVQQGLPEKLSKFIMKNPRKYIPKTGILPNNGLKILRKMHYLEHEVIESADLFIFPTLEQCKYMLGEKFEKYKEKCLIIPHTYDSTFYPINNNNKDEKFCFTYIGHADAIRNPINLIFALKKIKESHPNIAEKIKLKFVGNIPQYIVDAGYAFFLYEHIEKVDAVDYMESLKIMKESDCLVHVDGKFDFLDNGSIFFASKLADYMGANKPILGITTANSPASHMLDKSQNVYCDNNDIEGLAENMIKLVEGKVSICEYYYQEFDIQNVYKIFDNAVKNKRGNLE